MDAAQRLDELVRLVEEARSMPMSASCVLNRAEVLGLLLDLRASLPQDLGVAAAVLAEREGVLAAAQGEADRVVAEARVLAERLVDEHDLAAAAQVEAARVVAAAHAEAAALREEVDDYVDGRLANFEAVLERIVEAVRAGREQMRGSSAPERR